MGLDQYLYKVKTEMPTKEYSEKIKEIERNEEGFLNEERLNMLNKGIERKDIGYWRKKYELDTHCSYLYHSKGGEEVFNCEYVELNSDDIQEIINKFKSDEYTVKVMKEALGYINKGYRIWYSNWY